MPNYPDSLPKPLLGGYKIALKNNVNSTTMAFGIKRRRQIDGRRDYVITFSLPLDNEDLGVFDNFFRETLSDGVVEFNMELPIPNGMQQSVRCRFNKPYQLEAMKTLWKVKCEADIYDVPGIGAM